MNKKNLNINRYIEKIYRNIRPLIPRDIKTRMWLLRRNKILTKLLGPRFEFNLNIIEIDITYDCDLKCFNCNRVCGLFPSKEAISVGQIQKFINESIEADKKWDRITVMGGEPTLHPDLFKIIELLLSYKRNFSPETKIAMVSNGYSGKTGDILSRMPKEVEISNTNKKSPVQQHRTFYRAPIDFKMFKDVEYINGCATSQSCGIGLTPYGYYPCAPCGAIDRVFGLDLGEKKLPRETDLMRKKLGIQCLLFF